MDDHMIRMIQLSQKGYVCSQIIMQLGLDMRGEENFSLIRAMAGLGLGCGSGKATCGALTGGASLLALFAGKGSDEEIESDRFILMLQQLDEWFSQNIGARHNGVSCESIVGKDVSAIPMQHCGQIVSDTFAKCVEILLENGFDLSGQ